MWSVFVIDYYCLINFFNFLLDKNLFVIWLSLIVNIWFCSKVDC